jgi:uncharacterized protein YegL
MGCIDYQQSTTALSVLGYVNINIEHRFSVAQAQASTPPEANMRGSTMMGAGLESSTST